MDNTDALAQLKDIHLPDPISWWPMAPGWYLVFAVVFILGLLFGGVLFRQAVINRPKKHALILLKRYQADYGLKRNTQLTSAQISELLRRVALVYYPRDQVAGLHGDAWVDFLTNTGKGIDFRPVRSLLIEAPFNAKGDIHLMPLITRAELWIKQRNNPCLK